MLDYAGNYNVELPARLVAEIPDGMEVKGMRGKLLNIVSDYRFQLTLHRGCIKSLEADCLLLQQRQYHMQRRGIRVDPNSNPASMEADAGGWSVWRDTSKKSASRDGALGASVA